MTAVKISTLPVVIFFKCIYIYIYLLLTVLGPCCRLGFSLVQQAGASLQLGCVGFSLQWLLLLPGTGSRHAGFSSCSRWAPEHRPGSCGTWAQLLGSMWDLSGSGIEPTSPALVVDSLPLSQQGKPTSGYLFFKKTITTKLI